MSRAFLVAAVALCVGSAQAAELTSVREFREMCDASAMIPVGDNYFLAANDEDNTLRLFERDGAGTAVATFKLDKTLGVSKPSPEVDFEGAAQVDDLIYWIGSHGNNKDGQPRPNRHRFFATRLNGAGVNFSVDLVGKPQTGLLAALAGDSRLADCRWSELTQLAPEQPGAVNIEGLAATSQGTLWIAFRNPVPSGQALLIELKNPSDVINGQPFELGRIARLDLGGSGIRSLEYWPAEKAFLIVSGPFNDDGAFELWRWSGEPADQPTKLPAGRIEGYTPEAVTFFGDRPRDLWVLSDDGSRNVNGEDCKAAPKKLRHFRAGWIKLSE
jgi:hypothetical protein